MEMAKKQTDHVAKRQHLALIEEGKIAHAGQRRDIFLPVNLTFLRSIWEV